MKQNEFYCVSCRKRVNCHPEDIRVKTDRNGRPRMVGYDKYDHKVFKYIKESDYSKLKKKYN